MFSELLNQMTFSSYKGTKAFKQNRSIEVTRSKLQQQISVIQFDYTEIISLMRVTCNKVEDDGIGAFICIDGPGNVPHHSTWRGVLRHCKLLVRQAATLRCTHTTHTTC